MKTLEDYENALDEIINESYELMTEEERLIFLDKFKNKFNKLINELNNKN